jgi:hypothetical protein
MMKPRLNTSKKSVGLPVDYTKMVTEVIAKNFKKYAKDKKVIVEGWIYNEEIIVRIGFQATTGVAQRNFEASVDYSPKKKDVMDQVNAAIDALGSMIDQWIKSDEDLELPTTWHKFDMDGKAIYLQTSTENSSLESEADKLLAELDELDDEDEDDEDQ